MPEILLMEDTALGRELLTALLQREGHTVRAYPDAAPALAEVDLNQIDLIITDLYMPLPGDRAIEILRGRGVTTPIILLSGSLDGKEDERLLSLGADWVMAKPFDIEVLLEAVGELLADRQVPIAEGVPAWARGH